jgi:hypothetical protein
MKAILPFRHSFGLLAMLCTFVFGLQLGGLFQSARPVPETQSSQPVTSEIITSPADVNAMGDGPVELEDIFTKDESITYQIFTIERRQKTISEEGKNAQVSYAVINAPGRQLAKFDGTYDVFMAGNDTNFGLFPVLGKASKQLIVEQTAYRNGRVWVVDLSPQIRFSPSIRTVFDTKEYGLAGGIQLVDVDHDGVYELLAYSTIFEGFGGLPHCCSPYFDVLFRFDDRKHKYVPASQKFPEFMLKGIDEELGKVNVGDDLDYRQTVLTSLIRYLYAGKSHEGWAFYEKEYRGDDKRELKAQLLKRLATEPIYQAMQHARN